MFYAIVTCAQLYVIVMNSVVTVHSRLTSLLPIAEDVSYDQCRQCVSHDEFGTSDQSSSLRPAPMMKMYT